MAWLFISHSSRDNAVAHRIRHLLEAEGYAAVFLDFDPEVGIPPGRDWERELYSQLRMADAVVFLNSPAAVASPWCFAELALARSIGVSIVPVRLAGQHMHPLLRGVQWLDFYGDPADGMDRLRRALRELDLDPVRSLTWDRTRPPYPGLHAFEPEDAAVFFGREAEIKDLVKRLHPTLQRGAQRLVAVVGPSGSGKSSLVRAGLVPRLRKQGGWVVLPVMEPGVRPTRSLARVLARALDAPGSVHELEQRLLDHAGALADVAQQLCDNALDAARSLLLLIDQAEELVTLTGAQERAAFIEVLRETLTADGVLWVIATVRSEFLEAVLTDGGLADMFNEPQLLGPLDRARLFEVVYGPARRAGIELEEALVARMVDDTVGGDALPLLAYTLRRLWDRRAGAGPDATTTIDDYEAIGGVVGSLRMQADSIADELRKRGQGELVLPTLTRLATIDGEGEPARRRLKLDVMSSGEREVAQAFVDARLLTVAGEGDQATIAVAHEALLRSWTPLRQAIEEARTDLRTRSELERLSADWERSGRRDAYLLRGLRLHDALGWAAAHESELAGAPLIREFLTRGRRSSAVAPSPDDVHYQSVVRYLAEQELVLVLGSRLNRAGREQLWTPDCGSPPEHEELAVELARRFELDPETLELSEVAQAIQVTRGTVDLEKAVTQILTSTSGIGPVQRFLARLPRTLEALCGEKRHQLIMTANFDAGLERAFQEAGERYDLVVYMVRGEHAGRFLHVTPEGVTAPIMDPASYLGLPISPSDGELSRSVIVKLFGSVPRRTAGGTMLDGGYVMTGDDLDGYLSARDVPLVILAKLLENPSLFLGHTARDDSLRVLMRRFWSGRSRHGIAWAVDRDVDRQDQEFWERYGVERFAADLAEYAEQLERCLLDLSREPQREPKATGIDDSVSVRRHAANAGASTASSQGPFVGLSPYQEDEPGRFLGRETECRILIANLRVNRLVLLAAGSGVGTSSLLVAGVTASLRHLARERRSKGKAVQVVPVYFRSWWVDPLHDLIRAIETSVCEFAAPDRPFSLPRDGLDDAIKAAADAVDATLIILLDQFEEYVLGRSHGLERRFAEEAAHCINSPELRANFLIAVHDYAYAALGDVFGHRIPNLYAVSIGLDHLDRASARAAILGPIDHFNRTHPNEAVEVEGALIDAVLDGIAGADDRVAAPMLQLAMAGIWEHERAEGSPTLRRSTLEALGGAAGLLRKYLRRALDDLGPDEREVTKDLLRYLVSPSGAKIVGSAFDLAEFTGHREDRVASVLRTLEQQRIVRPLAPGPGEPSGRSPRYEIFHDALGSAILEWRSREATTAPEHAQRSRTKRWRRR